MKKLLSVFLFFVLCSLVHSQESWSLNKCIEYALENNLQVKQNLLLVQSGKYDATQAKLNMLPNLNGFASHGYNFGRTIDPFTNQFTDQRIQSNSFSLSSNFTVFSGFQRMNNAHQTQLNYQAAQFDADNVQNNISLSIATAYLQILFNQELLKIANGQLALTSKQVEQTKKLVDAEKLAKGSLYDMQAQLSQEEMNKVNADNNLALAILNLKQLLDLPVDTPFNIEVPAISVPENEKVQQRPGSVYQAAVGTMPNIKASEYRLLSAEKGLAISRSGMSPTLSLATSIGTGFSDQRQDITQTFFDGFIYQGSITAAGDSVFTESYSFDTETTPFLDQLENNFNQTVGFNLSIPIFNGWSTRTAINKAKVNMESSRIELQLQKNELQKTIYQAHADAVAALRKFRASEKTVTAQKESFNYTQKRFDVGLVNAVDYNDAKTRLTNVQSELLQAKYDYFFKTKVLDFYLGKPLTF